uniref:Uncharacterized protein n=1 Tax=Anguilla anguilla TaxID=7936 RepID=A0A0E9QL79_ANGAN
MKIQKINLQSKSNAIISVLNRFLKWV